MQHKYIFKYKKLVSLKIQKINHLKHVLSAEIKKKTQELGGSYKTTHEWIYWMKNDAVKVRVRVLAISEAIGGTSLR